MVARGPAQGRGPGAPGPETPLVGRDAELAALKDALASGGGLVLIAGEAGLGKTRLVREIERLAEADGRPTVWGRPEQVTTPGPFALVLDLVENLIGRTRDPASASDERALVGRLLDPHEWGGTGSPPVREIAARLRGFLSELGARPVAIFEDLHAADAASHAVVAHLAHSAADDGHLLVATYRPEDVPSDDALARFLSLVTRERLAHEIALKPLDPESSAALATSLLAGAAPEDVERVVALAEGVPFFVEELATARARAGEPTAVPDTIARAVVERRRQLGEEAQRVVVAASLAPGWIDPDVLADALGLGRDVVAAALAAGVRAGLLEDRDGRLVFRHALVRESVRADLVSVEEQELHRLLAAAIERVHAARIEPHAKALSYHWYRARDRERARRYALAAGERALALGAAQDARDSYELALACGPGETDPDALLGLAEAGIREGRTDQVAEILRRAADEFRRAGRHAEAVRALARLAWVLSVGQSPDAALAVVNEALAAADEPAHPAGVARLLALKGEMLVLGRSAEEGEPLLHRAAEIARDAEDHEVRAESLDSLAWAADQTYRAAEALSLGDEACREALLAGSAEIVGRTHNNVAFMHVLHGRPDEALRLLETARERLTGSFGGGGVAIINLTEAIARWYMGEPAAVARLVARGEVGWARWRGYARILQAWSSLHAGDRERAIATVARRWEEVGAGKRAEALDPAALDPETSEAAMCELMVRLEDADAEALPLAESLLAFTRGGSPDNHLLAAGFAARAALLAGNARGARRALDEMRHATARYGSPYFAGLAFEIEGLLAGGGKGRAEDLFLEAASAFESCANVVDRARAVRLAGEAAAPEARERAVEHLRQARELAFRAGSQAEVGRAESALRALGIRPRAGRPRKTHEPAGALSTREEEVATLVAVGSTNAEIASRLYLSERTVQDHITHALRKLGLSGRAGLAAWAAKQGLV